MAITWADVTAIAPALASVAIGMQAAILAQVDLQVDATAWGPAVDIGKAWLAAHLAKMALAGGVGPAGAVIGETVGPMSRQYAQLPTGGGDPALEGSSYGREYKRLMRAFVVRI